MLRDGTRPAIESGEEHAPTWASGSATKVPGPARSGPRQPRAAEPRAAEPRRGEPRAAEPCGGQPRPAEPRPVEPRPAEPRPAEPRWQTVDRALRQIAARRAALDAEEA